jgi:N-acetylmuramoyl-L-alanine amidase
VIDPGHGGVDPGMLGVNDTVEKEINLAIAYRLKEKLEEQGIMVVLTRTTDDGLYAESDSNKKIADMKKRCSIISENKADIVLSIHQNSFSDSAVCGAQVFYYKHSEKGSALHLATD